MPQTETPVSQIKINELTRTQFNNAPSLSENELYAVDPEFTGGKLLKTDNDGNIVESTATEADAIAGGTAIQDVEVNGTSVVSGTTASITVPTNNNQLTNGAGYITSSALNGYATQTWVGQQGYITSSALSGYQTTANLVTSISSSSTDSQYPSAKCVYDIIGNIETLLSQV